MKKNLFAFIISFIMLFIPCRVSAEVCSDEEIKTLTSLKKTIEIKYTHLSEEEAKSNYDVNSDNMYVFSFYNVPKDITIISPFGDARITNTTSDNLTNILNVGWGFGGNTGEFVVYASDDYHCFANLGTIKITLPWYNKYSTTKECKENPKFKYCKKYLNIKIQENTFNKELSKYINNKVDNSNEKEKENNFVVRFIKDNYILIVSSIGIIVVTSIILIKKNKKRRISI